MLLPSVGLRGDAAEARRAKIEGYLSKPVRQSDLYNCLATVMGREADGTLLITRHTLSEKPPRLRGRILLAEDNPVNQEVILAMVESLGCGVDIAADGQEALEKLAGGAYDLVLMDCQMPGKDGLEATAEIRRRESAAGGRRLPVVALTANDMEGDRERCLAAGMDDYLSKPLRREVLEAALAKWLSSDRDNGGSSPAARLDANRPAAGGAPARTVEGPPASPAPLAQEPAGADGPIDMKTLESMRTVQQKGRTDLVFRAVNLYLRSSPEQIRELHEAVDRNEAAVLNRLAHSLKSSSAMVGALRLSRLCGHLEAQARDARLDFAAERVAEIETEFARVVLALEVLGQGGES